MAANRLPPDDHEKPSRWRRGPQAPRRGTRGGCGGRLGREGRGITAGVGVKGTCLRSWGKFIPAYDLGRWAEHYRTSLPRLVDFLELRARRDPHDVFFTGYWRERLTTPVVRRDD